MGQEVRTLLGISSDDIVRDPEVFFARVHPADAAALQASAGEREGARRRSVDVRVRVEPGGWRLVRDQFEVLPSGDLEGWWTDLTVEAHDSDDARERRVRSFLDAVSPCAAFATSDGRLSWVNQSALGHGGLSLADALGLHVWESPCFGHSATAQERVRAAVARAMDGETVRIEITARVGGGPVLDLDLVVGPLDLLVGPRSAEAGPGGEVFGFALDPTARRVSERERERVAPALLEALVRAQAALLAGENIDATVRALSEAVRRAAAEDEGAAGLGGSAVAQFHEVVERERARREAEARLRWSEARFRAVIEAALDPVIAIDERGLIESFNRAAERLFGWPASEVLGRNVSILTPSPHRERHVDYLARYIQTGERRVIGLGRQVEGQARDGTLIALELSVAEGWAGGTRFFVGSLRDIRERKAAEASLLETHAALARSDELKSEFIANASHELRTPLNAVVGFTELLRDGVAGPLNERQRDYVEQAFSGARHLLVLVNDILDLSKIDAGRMALDVAPLDAEEVFGTALGFVSGAAQERGVALSSDIAEAEVAGFEADGLKLFQVTCNLLSNAVKFTPRGGEVALRVRLVPVETLELTVEDTGPGLSPADVERLFQPFERLKVGGAIEGTGLGLVLVKRLVELHGGAVHIESGPWGSRFVARIPSARRSSAAST